MINEVYISENSNITDAIGNIPAGCNKIKIINNNCREYSKKVIECLKKLPETVTEVDLSFNYLYLLDICNVLSILKKIPQHVNTLSLENNNLQICLSVKAQYQFDILNLLEAIPKTVKNVYMAGNYLKFNESDSFELFTVDGADVIVKRESDLTIIKGLDVEYSNNPKVAANNANYLDKGFIFLALISIIVTFAIAIKRLVTKNFFAIFTSKIFFIMLGFSVLFSVTAYLLNNPKTCKSFEKCFTSLFLQRNTQNTDLSKNDRIP